MGAFRPPHQRRLPAHIRLGTALPRGPLRHFRSHSLAPAPRGGLPAAGRRHPPAPAARCPQLTTSRARPVKSLLERAALRLSSSSRALSPAATPSALLRVFTVFTLALNSRVMSTAMAAGPAPSTGASAQCLPRATRPRAARSARPAAAVCAPRWEHRGSAVRGSCAAAAHHRAKACRIKFIFQRNSDVWNAELWCRGRCHQVVL